MGSFKNTLLSNDGLRTTFVIIFVAFILTIYELTMFFFIITPEVKTQIDNSLSNVIKDYKKNIKTNLIDDKLNKIMDIQKHDKLTDFFNNSIANNLKTEITNTVTNTIDDSKKYIINITEVLSERDQLLTNKINGYTKVTGFLILFSLILIMGLIYNTLRLRGEGLGNNVIFVSVFTLVLIMSFQYLFYHYGKS